MNDRIKSRWIPGGSTKITPKGIDAVAYVLNRNRNGKIQAVGYIGKAGKPAFNYTFRDVNQLSKYISEWRNGLLQVAKYKAERKAAKKDFAPTLAVGDILRSSWGYDQTNIDYYEVTKVLGKYVEIRELSQESKETGFMSGQCIPTPGNFIGKPMRKKVQQGNSVKIESYAYAYPVEYKMIAGAKIYDSSYWSSYA